MRLHLCRHPLAFFGKQFLNLMGKILRIASSRIVGTEDVEGYSGCFSLNLSDNSVMRERVSARRTLKGLVVDLRIIHERNNIAKYSIICMFRECFEIIVPFLKLVRTFVSVFTYLTQLSQAINSPSVPNAVGKSKISIEKNREKTEKIYLSIFIY